jgi:hypothetical protein
MNPDDLSVHFVVQRLFLTPVSGDVSAFKEPESLLSEFLKSLVVPLAKEHDAQIMKVQKTRVFFQVHSLEKLEAYIQRCDAVLLDFKKEGQPFFFESQIFVYASPNTAMSTEEKTFLRFVTEFLDTKTGIYTSQNLNWQHFILDKSVFDDGAKTLSLLRPVEPSDFRDEPAEKKKRLVFRKAFLISCLPFLLVVAASALFYVKTKMERLRYESLWSVSNADSESVLFGRLLEFSQNSFSATLEKILAEHGHRRWQKMMSFGVFPSRESIENHFTELRQLQQRFSWSPVLNYYHELFRLFLQVAEKKPEMTAIEKLHRENRDSRQHFLEISSLFKHPEMNPYFSLFWFEPWLSDDQNGEIGEMFIKFFMRVLTFNIDGQEKFLAGFVEKFPRLGLQEMLLEQLKNDEPVVRRNSFVLCLGRGEFLFSDLRDYLQRNIDEEIFINEDLASLSQLQMNFSRDNLIFWLEGQLDKFRVLRRYKEYVPVIEETIRQLKSGN